MTALLWDINIPILQVRKLRPSKVKQGLWSPRELVTVGTGPRLRFQEGVASKLTSFSAPGALKGGSPLPGALRPEKTTTTAHL